MVTLITDPRLEGRLKAERHAWGGDRYDEVWEGTYVMSPLPNIEHQEIVSRLVRILGDVVGWPGQGEVFPGINLSDRGDDWEHDYRAPDVAVFLPGNRAEKWVTHFRGPADFLVEILSPGDRTREKIPFYSRLGVQELLLVDRQPWTLELYRWQNGQLQRIGQSTLDAGDVLVSEAVPLTFQLASGSARPQILVVHPSKGQSWLV